MPPHQGTETQGRHDTMADATHYKTAPEDRIPLIQKIIYGLGAFVNNLLAAAIGGMVIVLNLGLGKFCQLKDTVVRSP